MRVLVEGVGAVGARVARQLTEADDVDRVLLGGSGDRRMRDVLASTGPKPAGVVTGGVAPPADVAVLAGPAGTHAAAARDHVAAGRSVVSVSDDLGDVRALLELGPEAQARGATVVAGAGFAPGLSCLLVAIAARRLDDVDEIEVDRLGVGGPACARHRRRALGRRSLDWNDHRWDQHPGGTGRQLRWFPDPVGGVDCFRAELPDAALLVPVFPGASRVTARVAAAPLERVGSRLPIPQRPVPEGELGALRVEVRGRSGGAVRTVVLGALDRPAVAAGALAALVARAAGRGELASGASGVAALADPAAYLAGLAEVGVKAAEFVGETT